MRAVALLLLCTIAGSAQPAQLQEEFSSISGSILDKVTGDPVGKAALRLMRVAVHGGRVGYLESARHYGANSDAAGMFEITGVEPGRYRLFVSRTGFVDFEYGAHGSQSVGAILDLEPAQQLEAVELRLTPQSVIAGRVIDSDGEAVGESGVFLLRSQYINGKKALSLAGNGVFTDDRGEYRIFGLSSGQYYLYAAPNAASWSLTSAAEEDYVPAYYPGATEASGAVAILVDPGGEVRADIVIRRERTVSVKGRVLSNVTGGGDGLLVSFTRQHFHQTPSATGQTLSHPAKVDAEGNFEVRGLTPGSYVALAYIRRGVDSYKGRTIVDVSGSEIEGISIAIDANRFVSGRVVVDGETDTPRLPALRLRPSNPQLGINSSAVRIGDDGVFRIDGLETAEYALGFLSIPDGFYLKSIQAGRVDITYTGIDLTRGSIEDLEIVLSPNAGRVAGAVRNNDTGEATLGATVILVPEEPTWAEIPWLYPQATTDQYGRFSLPSVTPGAYRAYAWEQVEDTAWMDPEFMRPLRNNGKRISVDESSEVGAQLDLILNESE